MSQNSAALDQQLDPVQVQQAMDLIAPAQRIALLAHEGPDGDCLGSALGMAFILQTLGKTCVPACADPPPPNLAFLPGIETVARDLGDEAFDLVIALDASEIYRFGRISKQHQNFLALARILNIDHHLSSGGCGQVNIIDPNAAATAELVVLFQKQAGLPLPQEAALCLLTGLITDTNSFQFTNTTPRSLEVAAELLRHGASPKMVAQPIYRERPLALARFQATIIDHVNTSCEGRLIWSWANNDTLAQTGATSDLDDNTAGMLHDISGVQIAVVFKSFGAPNVTRISMRCSPPYNAAEICQHLSDGPGGGHARAAGATFYRPIPEAIAFVIPELEKILHNG